MSNCEGNGSDISESVGGSVTFGQAWSTDVSIGFELESLHIAGGGGWTESSAITYDQSVSITISHGYMVGYFVFAQGVKGSYSIASRVY